MNHRIEAGRIMGPVRIQSLARADAILETIASSPSGEAGLSDIARRTGLHKTTVFHLVESLRALGFVAQNPRTRAYRLGLRNLQLGRILQRRLDVSGAARPALMRLCASTGETVNLAVPYLFDTMIVDSFEGSFSVRATSYAGTRAPFHSTSCGKAVLAYLDEPTRQSIYAHGPLHGLTPRTITDAAELERHLVLVRSRGFATDLEENEIGAHCVAVPVFDQLGEVVASISVAGPASRLSEEKLPATAETIRREAAGIFGVPAAGQRRRGSPKARGTQRRVSAS